MNAKRIQLERRAARMRKRNASTFRKKAAGLAAWARRAAESVGEKS